MNKAMPYSGRATMRAKNRTPKMGKTAIGPTTVIPTPIRQGEEHQEQGRQQATRRRGPLDSTDRLHEGNLTP